ncbi:hypothetical protein SUGI_0844160 [Cryptomeria japonica]|nr:hypothetical protein SUGI_0844160 [Cryptomeria japonica]
MVILIIVIDNVQDSKQREPKHKGTSSCSSSAVHLQGKAAIQQHQLFIRVFPPACKRYLIQQLLLRIQFKQMGLQGEE